MRLLPALDCSEKDANVLARAATLARPARAKMTLLHVPNRLDDLDVASTVVALSRTEEVAQVVSQDSPCPILVVRPR